MKMSSSLDRPLFISCDTSSPSYGIFISSLTKSLFSVLETIAPCRKLIIEVSSVHTEVCSHLNRCFTARWNLTSYFLLTKGGANFPEN